MGLGGPLKLITETEQYRCDPNNFICQFCSYCLSGTAMIWFPVGLLKYFSTLIFKHMEHICIKTILNKSTRTSSCPPLYGKVLESTKAVSGNQLGQHNTLQTLFPEVRRCCPVAVTPPRQIPARGSHITCPVWPAAFP